MLRNRDTECLGFAEAGKKFGRGPAGGSQAEGRGSPGNRGQTYEFVFWLLPKVEGFDKKHKFTVGERLTANGLDLLTTLVEAAYSREKSGLLREATRKIDSTRYLLRLAKDLRLMSVESYRFSAEKLAVAPNIKPVARLVVAQAKPGGPHAGRRHSVETQTRAPNVHREWDIKVVF